MKPHEFLYDGKLYCLRCINRDGTSYGGFVNSTTVGSEIIAPDFDPKPECGHGLHAWPLGIGREGKEFKADMIWQVVSAYNVVPLDGKIKAQKFIVEVSGTLPECERFLIPIRQKFCEQNSTSTSGFRSSAATSGNYSSAATSGGCSSVVTSGDCSSATTSGSSSSAATSGVRSSAATSGVCSSAATSGVCSSAATSGYYSSAATSGSSSSVVTSGSYSSAATSGVRSSAVTSGDYSSAVTSGDCSSAVTSGKNSLAGTCGINCQASSSESSVSVCVGFGGKVKSGRKGAIVLSYVDKEGDLQFVFGKVGVDIKSDTWYKLNKDNHFEECESE